MSRQGETAVATHKLLAASLRSSVLCRPLVALRVSSVTDYRRFLAAKANFKRFYKN
jgi:hypothetical protein